MADNEALPVQDPARELRFVRDAVALIRRELSGRVPLIGFAGSPWTVATYMIEGGSSRDFARSKALLYGEPRALHALLGKLARATTDYLNAQVEAGAQAVQIFDSWAGILGLEEYRAFAFPFVRELVAGVRNLGAPVIYFVNGGPHLLETAATAGAEVLGVCWRTPLDEVARRVGPNIALQGNLDPHVLLAGPDAVSRAGRDVLDRVAGRPGHVFNLGHGIMPDTPIASVEGLVATVADHSARHAPR